MYTHFIERDKKLPKKKINNRRSNGDNYYEKNQVLGARMTESSHSLPCSYRSPL
jgi:hypothetical protein